MSKSQMFESLTKGSLKSGYPINAQRVLLMAIEVLHSCEHHTLATELTWIQEAQKRAIEGEGCSCLCHEGGCSSAPPYCGHHKCIDPEVNP